MGEGIRHVNPVYMRTHLYICRIKVEQLKFTPYENIFCDYSVEI